MMRSFKKQTQSPRSVIMVDMKKKFLVTGGAGFIGSWVVERLIDGGSAVVVVDDFNDYYDPEVKLNNLSAAQKTGKLEVVKADISEINDLKSVFEKDKFEGVIHLAARAGVRPSLTNPGLYVKVNVMGTVNLLELMAKYGVKKLVFASSSSVYGNRRQGPFKESDNTDNQISPYGATKKATELMVQTYSRLYGINATGLRFFTVYGPRNRPDMACYKFLRAIETGRELTRYGSGDTGRDYTYIGDIVEGVVRAYENLKGYEIYNLGNSSPLLLNQMIATFEAVTGKKAQIKEMPLQEGDVEFTFADINKAREKLGWEPKTSFREGVEQLVAWYRQKQTEEA